jgi:hypothetical protein
MMVFPDRPWTADPGELAPYLSRIFWRLGEAIAGQSTRGDKAYRYIEVFLWKFVDHFGSAFHLAKGTRFPGIESVFLDMSSINLIVRASWECHLTMSYLYIQSKTKDEMHLRFWSWFLNGLFDRQKVPLFDDEMKRRQEAERRQIADIIADLHANPAYGTLSPKERAAIVKGRWRWPLSWAAVARNAGYSEFLSDQFYGFLSHYAHSGSGSLVQLADQPTESDARRLLNSSLRLLLCFAAHVARDYCTAINLPTMRLLDEEQGFLAWLFKLPALNPASKQPADPDP